MTRVIESLLLIEFQIFVKFDPGQKSGSFIKFPRVQQPITFLWKEKRKKKKEESAAALSKSAKNSPGQTAAAAPRLVPLNFRSSTERQRVDRVCFSSLRGWLEGRCAAGGTRSKGKNLETRRFFEPSTRTFSRGASFKRNWCGFLARRGIWNRKRRVWSTKNATIGVKIYSLRRGNFVPFDSTFFFLKIRHWSLSIFLIFPRCTIVQ